VRQDRDYLSDFDQLVLESGANKKRQKWSPVETLRCYPIFQLWLRSLSIMRLACAASFLCII
jgi:hypothetical protein